MGWAEAVAISDGRVVAAGRREELEPLAAAGTRHLALGPDEVAVPALTDAHLHLLDAALAGERLDLGGADRAATLARIAAAHAALVDPDAWLEGDDWTADGWGGWPDAADLERVAPGRRAAFWAHDRHSMWVSTRALEEAGVTAATSDPAGGVIRRRADGSATGVLHETAVPMVLGRIPRPTPERLANAVARLAQRLVAAGLAAIHDPGWLAGGPGLGGLALYRSLESGGRLPLDVHASIRAESLEAAIASGYRSGAPLAGTRPGRPVRTRMGWLKIFADGTLGSRTAAMLEPFEPEPGSSRPAAGERGMYLVPPDELAALVARAAGAGIATQVHAIGDAAARAGLDALAAAPHRLVLSPRIEHAQLVDPADLPRFAAAGVAASVQPVHLGSDAPTARTGWGTRAERAYPYRSLLDAGALLAIGTDAPIEPWDPWPGVELAVTRRGPDWASGTPSLGPAEALSLAEALRAACVGPALVAGQPDRGRLVRGHRADLLVLPADALATPVVPGGPLGRVRPRLVLLGGVEVAST
jgi:predicted amidohydrolase YtcJ